MVEKKIENGMEWRTEKDSIGTKEIDVYKRQWYTSTYVFVPSRRMTSTFSSSFTV